MMDEKKLDHLITGSFKRTAPEINLHGIVMDRVERYEKKKIARSYLCEIIVSSLLMVLSVLSFFFINWYFSVCGNVFQLFPLATSLMRMLVTGIFIVILTVVAALDVRMIHMMFKERVQE